MAEFGSYCAFIEHLPVKYTGNVLPTYTPAACPRDICRDVTLQKLPQNQKSPPKEFSEVALKGFSQAVSPEQQCPSSRRSLYASLLIPALLLSGCKQTPVSSQVSEQPPVLVDSPAAQTSARHGTFGIRSRIAYSDIQAIIESEIPDNHPVADSKRICKRIIGIKACGTANWDLTVSRVGAIQVSGKNEKVLVNAPISFTGTVGMDGRVAKVLGLSKLDVRGSVIADITLGMDVDESWCPALSTSVSYRWQEKPTAVWNNKLDFSLEKVVNNALDKQLAELEPRLNAAIDCEKFRTQLQEQWRSYSFAIDLPDSFESSKDEKLHLNFTPTGFAFSGIHTEANNLGVGFAISGTTVVESSQAKSRSLDLPTLQKLAFKQSRTDFDILLRSDYTQLEALIKPRIQGKTYSADSLAGTATVTISNIGLASNASGVTISLGFVAQLPGKRGDTIGQLFLMATPVVDSDREQLSLENIQLSKVLDSALWDVLSSVFESQIISAIERNAVINYSTRMRELESKIAGQLSNPERTAGLDVTASGISIKLLDIIPESTALAIVARVGADLDIDVPLSLIKNTRNK